MIETMQEFMLRRLMEKAAACDAQMQRELDCDHLYIKRVRARKLYERCMRCQGER